MSLFASQILMVTNLVCLKVSGFYQCFTGKVNLLRVIAALQAKFGISALISIDFFCTKGFEMYNLFLTYNIRMETLCHRSL